MSERITLIEIDLDRCSNTYGIAPCTAALGVTGSDKCFNSFATCQDQPNYNTEIATARYSTSSAKIPASIDAIPNIASVSYRPTKLELGESIGIRASINITFKDSRFPDSGPEGDRYLIDRDYDPYTRGSYWGKFRARWPYVKGSDIRLIRGDTSQTVAQMETRHFIVEKVAGPDSSGTFTIQCKDALQLADGKQSQAPLISNGALDAAITTGTTSITLKPPGIGNTDYPASGLAQIGGEEVVTFTRAADVMTIVRGQENTSAADHDQDSRVQLCINYTGNTVTNIINDLLVNYANVPSSFIPITDWTKEDDTYIGRNYSAVIAEPTSVTKLINELLEQTASTIWWDDISKLIRFRVLRSVNSDAALYTDDIIIGGSFSATDQPDKRVSQVWTYYGQLSPLEKLNETKNYAATQATVSPESELNFNGVPSIKRIFSRWIPSVGKDAAEKLNELILSRYSTPPRLISFNLQRSTFGVTPELGGGYRAESRTIQDFTGATVQLPIQALQIKTSDSSYSILAEEVLYSSTIAPTDPAIKNVTIQENANNITLKTYFDSVWATLNSGDVVNISVEDGVTIGSSSTEVEAIVYGDWPNGITINLTNNGIVVGKGGAGGAGGRVVDNSTVENGGTGGDGGDAISVAQPNNPTINIINNGTIGSGGGGGGGGGAVSMRPYIGQASFAGTSGSGGGGGAYQGVGGVLGAILPGLLIKEDARSFGYSHGLSGQTSANTILGLGGAQVNKVISKGDDIGTSVYSNNGKGGDGGGLGVQGKFGSAGAADGTEFFSVTSSGGAGGDDGSSINKSGKTVTITNNGTILGAVIA